MFLLYIYKKKTFFLYFISIENLENMLKLIRLFLLSKGLVHSLVVDQKQFDFYTRAVEKQLGYRFWL